MSQASPCYHYLTPCLNPNIPIPWLKKGLSSYPLLPETVYNFFTSYLNHISLYDALKDELALINCDKNIANDLINKCQRLMGFNIDDRVD